MKSLAKIFLTTIVFLFYTSGIAQIKNSKTETVKISGNCSMCKTTIEKAGNKKKQSKVDWNKDSKIATLIFNSKTTNEDEILKRIALAGYDNEKYLAPEDAYAKLPECCKYNRELKPLAKVKDDGMDMKSEHGNHNHSNMAPANSTIAQNVSQLKSFFDDYFSVKDALVKTDAVTTSTKATELVKTIKAVEMTKLSKEEHIVWMKVLKDLMANAEKITNVEDITKQRETFDLLSKDVYELAKISKQDTPVYYQHCPMYNNGKGADWLSKEEAIKNPYYGSQMLTCGSTVETIK